MLISRLKQKGIVLGTLVILTGLTTGSAMALNLQNNSPTERIHIASYLDTFTNQELASGASLILEGTVLEIHPATWNTPSGRMPKDIKLNDIVYTDVSIKIDTILKGTPKSNDVVTVRVYKGEIPGEFAFSSDTEADFSNNEKVLLFLMEDDSIYNKDKSQNHYVIMGQYQGKYTVEQKKVSNFKSTLDTKSIYEVIEKHKDDPTPEILVKQEGAELEK
ncbi:hypothetical protein [Brevibacillus sp. HD1.4A]|uniref:hypothetical protein n=2 Tax=Brevibacillus TaxID=55080 RepID=UPI00156AA1BF|nr:hypothetical protein [Brevibacillus sp. HD1.4A]NRQ56298.1 hypothetical protein [Brevibacillus sp. HD1.4A]